MSHMRNFIDAVAPRQSSVGRLDEATGTFPALKRAVEQKFASNGKPTITVELERGNYAAVKVNARNSGAPMEQVRAAVEMLAPWANENQFKITLDGIPNTVTTPWGFYQGALLPDCAKLEPTPAGNWIYHGTPLRQSAKDIVHQGLRPRSDTGVEASGNGWASPINGRVYLTPSLGTAVRYAKMEEQVRSTNEPVGFVFLIDRDAVANSHVMPDEDAVGAYYGYINGLMTLDAHVNHRPGEIEQEFWRYVNSVPEITPALRNRVTREHGTGAAATRLGKLAVANMPDHIIQHLMSRGYDFSVNETARPSQCWSFPKKLSNRLFVYDNKAMPLNFFGVAKLVWAA